VVSLHQIAFHRAEQFNLPGGFDFFGGKSHLKMPSRQLEIKFRAMQDDQSDPRQRPVI
jgi:hypothetical protein